MNTKTPAEMIAQARTMIDNLTPDQVEAEIAAGDAVLVDVRRADERALAAIADSLHAPREQLESLADPASPAHIRELDPGHRVILYCASGGRSALGGMTLRQLGYRDVAHLDGGIKAWIAAGKPVAP